MKADTRRTDSAVRPPSLRCLTGTKGSGFGRVCAVGMCLVAVLLLAGCKSKDSPGGMGVSRPKEKNDPLVHGPTSRIPRQDLPVPDRATGPKGRFDPLTTPTGGKAGSGYTEDPERFKGTFIPGKGSTPAALASRVKDGEELKIDDGGGVPLTPAGGTSPGGSLEVPADVDPLFAQLDKLGVKRADRFLEREGGQWVFRASVAINSEGAKRQYVGMAPTAAEAVKQVLGQLSTEK